MKQPFDVSDFLNEVKGWQEHRTEEQTHYNYLNAAFLKKPSEEKPAGKYTGKSLKEIRCHLGLYKFDKKNVHLLLPYNLAKKQSKQNDPEMKKNQIS